jgi:hypothetical protein
MGKIVENEELKTYIIEIFPNLASDSQFKITSPANPDYNCLAWACHYDNRWMQPYPRSYDGTHYWPDGAKKGDDIECLIDAYRKKGYELCENGIHEEGFQKIALYVAKGTTSWTHASRELLSGCWTSKLGQGNDIQHGTPYAIEGEKYGKVSCFMKRKFS